jgi:hypothetical protein
MAHNGLIGLSRQMISDDILIASAMKPISRAGGSCSLERAHLI